MNRNLNTLWRKLTKGDVSRAIYLRDLDPELDKILKDFALRLVTLHGNLRQGWCAICRAGGGHLHEEGFEVATSGLGIDARSSKLLFAVLDPHQRRYLTEFDSLEFLQIWNPGVSGGSALAAAAAAAALTESATTKTVAGAVSGGSPNLSDLEDKVVPQLGNFEFELVLSKEEYCEYLRRRRGARIRQSLQGNRSDPGAECRRKPPLGGNKPRPPSAPKPSLKKSHSQPTMGDAPHEGRSNNHNEWHGLAPNSLGGGKEALSRSAKMPSNRQVSSLAKMLSCPATTMPTSDK